MVVNRNMPSKRNVTDADDGKSSDLSTIEKQSLLLQKLRVEMDGLIENNIKISVENDMLRLRASRQRSDKTYLEEENNDYNSKAYQHDEVKSLRVFVQLLKHKIDKLHQKQNTSSEEVKNSFTPAQVDEIILPLKRQICEKELEITHWKNKLVRKKRRVSDLGSALLQKDKEIMDIVNESNTLVQKKSNEIKFLLDNRLEVDANKSKSVSLRDFKAKSLPALFGNRTSNKSTGHPNAKFSEIKHCQDSILTFDQFVEMPLRSLVIDYMATTEDDFRRDDGGSLENDKVDVTLRDSTDECPTDPTIINLRRSKMESCLQEVVESDLLTPNWNMLKRTEDKNDKLLTMKFSHLLPPLNDTANSRRATAA